MDELTVVTRARPSERETRLLRRVGARSSRRTASARELRIVGPDEFDPALGLLSMESPLGRALLGKREGDEVAVARPKGGELRCEVLAIRYESEPEPER